MTNKETKSSIYSELKELLNHSMVYGLGNIASKVIGFLMIPIYTRYLSPADYGIIELIDLVSAIAGLILYELIVEAIFRFYYKYDSASDKMAVISSSLIAHVCFSLLLSAIGLLLIKQVSVLITGTEEYHTYFFISFISFIFMQAKAIPIGYLRVRQKSKLFVVVSLSSLVLGLSLNIYLIVFRQMGIYGVLYSSLISNGIVAVLLGIRTFAEVGFGFSAKKITAMLKYGAPMIPSGIGMFTLNFSNRFFLTKYTLLSHVGLYALGARFGFMVHALIIQPFLEIWDSKMFQIAKEKDSKEIYSRALTYFLFVVIFAALGMSLLIKDALKIIVTPDFFDAHKVVPILCLGYVFMSFYYHFYVGILITQKTAYIGIIVGGAAILNLILNWLFIPNSGIVGAAWALALSYFAMSFSAYIISYRLYPVKYEWDRIMKMCSVALAIYLVSTMMIVDSIIISILIRFLMLIGFTVVLWVIGFYKTEETKKIKETVISVTVKLNLLKINNKPSLPDK